MPYWAIIDNYKQLKYAIMEIIRKFMIPKFDQSVGQ